MKNIFLKHFFNARICGIFNNCNYINNFSHIFPFKYKSDREAIIIFSEPCNFHDSFFLFPLSPRLYLYLYK